MQLHDIKPKHPGKAKRTRVGRGGKRGTTSGKGTKGQKSRSGRRIRPAIRDLIQRLPKRRGYSNKPLESGNQVINLKDLEKVTGQVTLASLIKAKIVKPGEKRVKILSNGEIKKAVEIKGISVSAEARKKIEAAGGKIL
jgi:large subunit ribosomal protein L15